MRSKNFIFLIVACLSLVTARTSLAFSLLGPAPEWQTPSLNYRQPGQIGGWMDVGQDYRWNTPYITYAFDPSFLNYFGTNGVKAVDEAMAIFNALPPASQINLLDYPTESERVNFYAQANNLYDVKSLAMLAVIEQLGLADPYIGVWRLQDRWIQPQGVTNYAVMQLNFDPNPPYHRSSYINDVLYTYSRIQDDQANGGAFPVVSPVDPTASGVYSAVASGNLSVGGFYTGLTRDDVGGLAYLIRSNNFNVEQLLPDVRVVFTNTANPTQLWTLDLAELIKNSQRTTNTAEQLLALTNYSNLSIISTNSYVAPVIETNRFAYYINYPWAPERVVEEIYTTNFVTLHDYEFGNIAIYSEFNERPVFVRISEIVPSQDHRPGLPDIRTNVIEEYFDTEFVRNGEFYIVPTNLARFQFTGEALATNVTITTNLDFFAETLLTTRTNTGALTNILTTDLATFSQIALTNDAESLRGLFPHLLILSSVPYPTNIVTSNYVTYLTNSAWDPAVIFSIGHLWIVETNIGTNFWVHTFGNVVTNFGDTASVATNTTVLVEETIIAPNPYDPAGSPFATNVFSSLVLTNTPMGNIYIVPTNLFGYDIVATQLVDVVAVTNTFVYTNIGPGAIEQSNTISYIRYETNYYLNVYPIEFVTTNELATNIFGLRREVFTFATNRLFEIYQVELLPPTNSIALRPGVEKLNFIRVNYQAGLGTNLLVITNEYVDTVITETGVVQQVVRRTATRPDIVFQADDLNRFARYSRSTTDDWLNNSGLNNVPHLTGPGVIPGGRSISYNSSWPAISQFTTGGIPAGPEEGAFVGWASFDGSTNAPVLYPAGTSIQMFESQVLNP